MLIYILIWWLTFYFRVNLEENKFRLEKNVSNINKTPITNNVLSNALLSWSISRETCVIVYTTITITMIAAVLMRAALFVSFFMNISKNLHNNMFSAITRATMYFFNTNSSGTYYILK